MEKIIKENKLKLTPQRLELIKILEQIGKEHPTFKQIYQSVKKSQPNMSRSTLYNNLKMLIKLGMLTSFNYESEIRYEINSDLHINVVDSKGKILDFKDEKLNNLLKKIVTLLEQKNIVVKNLIIIAN